MSDCFRGARAHTKKGRDRLCRVRKADTCINGISLLSKQSCVNWKRSQLAPLFLRTVQRRRGSFGLFPRGSGLTFYTQWAATRVAVVVVGTVGVLI